MVVNQSAAVGGASLEANQEAPGFPPHGDAVRLRFRYLTEPRFVGSTPAVKPVPVTISVLAQ